MRFGEHLAQRLGLLHRAREAVEDEAVRGVGVVEPVVDQGVGQRGGDEVTGVEVLLGLEAQLGLVADVVPEQVTGGDVRDAELLRQLLRLRALARAGRPQQNDSHLRNPS